MGKFLSKSVTIMFVFDVLMLELSSLFCAQLSGITGYLLLLTMLVVTLTGTAVLFLKANYKIREFNITTRNIYLLFEGVFIAHIPVAIMLFALTDFKQAAMFLVLDILLVFVALELYRVIFHLYLFKLKRVKNILIIGNGKNAKQMLEEIVYKKALRMQVAAIIKDPEAEEEIIADDNIPVISDINELPAVIKEKQIDIVIVAIQRRMEEPLLTLMKQSIPNDVDVYKLPDFYEMVTGKYYIDRMSVNWLFYDYMNNRSIAYDFCKRAFDIIAAIIILTVTSPILLYIGFRVKRTDGGPAVYTQNRVGKDGKVFKAYKLRTMYLNDFVPTSENLANADKQEADDRVIPFCKFVRKARFDEIPQMINILKGEMSIVGPRTEWEDLVKIYAEQIPYYACRQWVRTGWTGWAQINQGHCIQQDDIATKLQYDLYYLRHRNVLWEIGILVKAVFLALGGRHG